MCINVYLSMHESKQWSYKEGVKVVKMHSLTPPEGFRAAASACTLRHSSDTHSDHKKQTHSTFSSMQLPCPTPSDGHSSRKGDGPSTDGQ